jgi:5-methylcytosine-specific restriction endonuclease McrA/endogenous inhibitor of DNA gyrase (YacG/DUF329 family)
MSNPGNYWNDPIIRPKLLEAVRKANNTPEMKKKRSESAKRRWKLYGKKHWRIVSGKEHCCYNPNKFSMRRNGMDFNSAQKKRLRDDKCKWCGSKKDLQLDHIKAIINGGENSDDNAQTLCSRCNQKKRLEDIREAQQRGENGENPIKENTVPSWVRKSLEGVTTRGRVYRKRGSKYLRIEVFCTTCGKPLLRQPNELKDKKYSFCDCKCQGKWSYNNRIISQDGKFSTSASRESDDIV